MHLSLNQADLAQYVRKQFENAFPDGADLGDLPKFVELALGRVEHCFSRVRLKGFFADGQARFSHGHCDQYAIFLYYLANTAFREKREAMSSQSRSVKKEEVGSPVVPLDS